MATKKKTEKKKALKVEVVIERVALSKEDIVWATNEWWRRYEKDPEKFLKDQEALEEVRAAKKSKREPTLGEQAFAYMSLLLNERVTKKKRKASTAKASKVLLAARPGKRAPKKVAAARPRRKSS